MAKINKLWIPLWIDKWLFGSTRIELDPDERSVWLDLLVIASKNEGYIRANEDTPYPSSQLAGLLIIPIELLERTIEKCIKYDKIKRNENGTLYVINWEKYQFSDRHKRRMSAERDTMSEDEDTIKDNSIVHNNKKDNKKKPSTKKSIKFKKPTIEEIRAYCTERKNNVDPDQFFNFYESKGWMIGKNKMKNWKAAVRTWEKNDQQNQPTKSQPPEKKKFDSVKQAMEYVYKEMTPTSVIEARHGLPLNKRVELKNKLQADTYVLPLYLKAKKIIEAARKEKRHKQFRGNK